MMDFIKKRLFLIICCGIIVLSLGVFAWGMMIISSNKNELSKVQSAASKVATLRRQAVHDNIISQLKIQAGIAQSDEKNVRKIAHDTTSNRPLIFGKVFPKPAEEANRKYYYNQFSTNYCGFVDKLIAGLNGGDHPSQVEEQKVRDNYKKSSGLAAGAAGGDLGMPGMEMPGMGMPGMGGGYVRKGGGKSPVEKLIEDLRRRRAQAISLYVSPNAFCCYSYWSEQPEGDRKVMMINSWFTQIAAWIQQDVVLSIGQLNKTSVSVLKNPVKRLIEISFDGPGAGQANSNRGAAAAVRTPLAGASYMGQSRAVGRSVSELILPTYIKKPSKSSSATRNVMTGTSQGGTGNIAVPWTNHYSDKLVDVVQFKLVVIIDSTKIISFVNALQSPKGAVGQNLRNQITVLQTETEPLDITAEHQAGYYYGNASLVVLKLACEYVFFKIDDPNSKRDYEECKPAPVKAMFEKKAAAPVNSVYGG